jgi:hypothetical protein
MKQIGKLLETLGSLLELELMTLYHTSADTPTAFNCKSPTCLITYLSVSITINQEIIRRIKSDIN